MNEETIEYRLTNIEKTLTELKEVIIDNKLQARDIEDVKKQNGEILDAINAHDQRIKKLEVSPIQAKADKWQVIVDYVFKAVLAAVVSAVLITIGLNK